MFEFPGGSSTSAAQLERGNGGLRQAVRVPECGSAAGLRHSSTRSWDRQVDRLHQPRANTSLGLLFIEGEFLENLIYPFLTSPRFDLGSFVVHMHRNFFVLYATNPFSGIRAGSMRRCVARVEHIWVCGRLDLHCCYFLVQFLFSRYSRMQSGPDRLYALCETGLATHVVLHHICDLHVSDSSTIVKTELNWKMDRFLKST